MMSSLDAQLTPKKGRGGGGLERVEIFFNAFRRRLSINVQHKSVPKIFKKNRKIHIFFFIFFTYAKIIIYS